MCMQGALPPHVASLLSLTQLIWGSFGPKHPQTTFYTSCKYATNRISTQQSCTPEPAYVAFPRSKLCQQCRMRDCHLYKSSLKPFYSIGLWSTQFFGKVQNPSSRACRSWLVSVSHHVVAVQAQRQLGSLHGHLHMLRKARWTNVLSKQDQRSALSHHSAATENLKFGQNTGHDSVMHKMQQ